MLEEENDGIKLPSASQWVRVLGAVIGLTMMVLGVVYSVRIFYWIAEGVRQPEKVSTLIERWSEGIGGGASFEIELGGSVVPLSGILGVTIVGVAMWILVRIAFLFLTTGSAVIRNTLGEKEAIREILLHTFGPGQVKRSKDGKPGA